MKNNKLQVLCLFVLTICVVMNNIKCNSQEECRREIAKTNYMIFNLNDNEKFTLVEFLIERFAYEDIMENIYPPDHQFLEGADADVLPSIYHHVLYNERAVQFGIIHILGYQRVPFIPRIRAESYDAEVQIRRRHLNLAFHRILHGILKGVQMCVGNEHMKCALVGLIKRTLNNYEVTNQHECTVNNECVITTDEIITDNGQTWYVETPVREKYEDRYDPRGYYMTLFKRPDDGELVPWQSILY